MGRSGGCLVFRPLEDGDLPEVAHIDALICSLATPPRRPWRTKHFAPFLKRQTAEAETATFVGLQNEEIVAYGVLAVLAPGVIGERVRIHPKYRDDPVLREFVATLATELTMRLTGNAVTLVVPLTAVLRPEEHWIHQRLRGPGLIRS